MVQPTWFLFRSNPVLSRPKVGVHDVHTPDTLGGSDSGYAETGSGRIWVIFDRNFYMCLLGAPGAKKIFGAQGHAPTLHVRQISLANS